MAKFMLPSEIWCHILSYLDEKSLRTIASTCKLFFELVRGNEKLSGCIILKSVTLKDLATNIKNSEWIWDRWPSLKTLKIPLQFEYSKEWSPLKSIWTDSKQSAQFYTEVDSLEYSTGTDRSTEREVFDLFRSMEFETCSSLEKVVVFNCCWSIKVNYDLWKRFDGLRVVNLMEFSFHPRDIPLIQNWNHITVHICQVCLIRHRNYPEKDILPNAEQKKSEKVCKTCSDWCLSNGFTKRKEQ